MSHYERGRNPQNMPFEMYPKLPAARFKMLLLLRIPKMCERIWLPTPAEVGSGALQTSKWCDPKRAVLSAVVRSDVRLGVQIARRRS
jgi:hypothetical protein